MFSRLLNSIKGKQTANKRTICEVHRQIYDVLVLELGISNPEVINKIVPLLEEAFLLGVKVTDKLIEYKLSPQQTYITDLKNKEEVQRLRDERIRLVKILDEYQPNPKGKR